MVSVSAPRATPHLWLVTAADWLRGISREKTSCWVDSVTRQASRVELQVDICSALLSQPKTAKGFGGHWQSSSVCAPREGEGGSLHKWQRFCSAFLWISM